MVLKTGQQSTTTICTAPPNGIHPMASDRLFVDTTFVQARFNRREQYHAVAMDLAGRFTHCRELWTTEAIMLEICAAFRTPGQRHIPVEVWDQFHSDPR